MEKRLYIDEYKRGVVSISVSKNYIDYDHVGFFYDKDTSIGIIEMYLDTDLNVGRIYTFTFEDNNDTNIANYMILKKIKNKIYHIAEYYDGEFYKYRETHLSDMWMKCDAFKTLGINRDEWIKKDNVDDLENMITTMNLGDDTVIITENANGELYVIKTKYIMDLVNDWNDKCYVVPANDARVFFASWNGKPINPYEYTDFKSLIVYLCELTKSKPL